MKALARYFVTISAMLGACLPGFAVPLPVTLAGSRAAIRVEAEQVEGQELHGVIIPRYRYTIYSMDWDGRNARQRSFCSEREFCQGYASGDILVLSNSGREPGFCTLAVVDSTRNRVLEHYLLFSLAEFGVCSSGLCAK